jgi:hypothetical protein
MEWHHPRGRSKVETKKEEPSSGTEWSFVAAAVAFA